MVPAVAPGLPGAGAGDEGRGELTPEKRDEYRAALDRLRAIEGDIGSRSRTARRNCTGSPGGCSIGGTTRSGSSWSRPTTKRTDERSPMPRQNRVTVGIELAGRTRSCISPVDERRGGGVG